MPSDSNIDIRMHNIHTLEHVVYRREKTLDVTFRKHIDTVAYAVWHSVEKHLSQDVEALEDDEEEESSLGEDSSTANSLKLFEKAFKLDRDALVLCRAAHKIVVDHIEIVKEAQRLYAEGSFGLPLNGQHSVERSCAAVTEWVIKRLRPEAQEVCSLPSPLLCRLLHMSNLEAYLTLRADGFDSLYTDDMRDDHPSASKKSPLLGAAMRSQDGKDGKDGSKDVGMDAFIATLAATKTVSAKDIVPPEGALSAREGDHSRGDLASKEDAFPAITRPTEGEEDPQSPKRKLPEFTEKELFVASQTVTAYLCTDVEYFAAYLEQLIAGQALMEYFSDLYGLNDGI
jgi:hypothetical protein